VHKLLAGAEPVIIYPAIRSELLVTTAGSIPKEI